MDLTTFSQAATPGPWVPLCSSCSAPIDRIEVDGDEGYPLERRALLNRAVRCHACKMVVHLGQGTLWVHAERGPA